MANRGSIPVPLAQRWKAFRIGFLPLLSFVAACTVALVMWNRQMVTATATGEVWAERVDIAVSVDGVLAQWPSRRWQLFDRVNAGDILARLDDRQTLALIATVDRELKMATAELESTAQEFRLERSDRDFERTREIQQLLVEIEKQRLGIAERKSLLEADQYELAGHKAKLETARNLRNPARRGSSNATAPAISTFDYQDVQIAHDAVEGRIRGHEDYLREAQAVLKEQRERLGRQEPAAVADVERALLPVRASIAFQEARLGELEIQRELLTIRAPISGHITQIYGYPGQSVSAGTILYTLASDDAQYIVSYVRQNQRLQPAVGMPVTIRSRLDTTAAANSAIDRIGPQVELVPAHQLRDQSQKVLEWGLPVRIPVPRSLNLRPGELVDLRFITNGQPPAAGQDTLLAEQG
jgi:multidrug resistance efflux pump